MKNKKNALIKKLLSFSLIFNLLFSFTAIANNDITVFVNGKQVDFDQPPTLINERTLVPARAISEMFNANVTWDNNTKTTTIVKHFKKDIVTSNIQIGDNKILVENFSISSRKTYPKTVTLDVPAMILNNRTMLPLRGISAALYEGCIWNANTRTVFLGKTPLSSAIGLADSVIEDMKSAAINTTRNALKHPNSALFSDWAIERYVSDKGYLVYCKVVSSEGTDYMRFNYDEENSVYHLKSASASTSDYADKLDPLSNCRYIFSGGRYIRF